MNKLTAFLLMWIPLSSAQVIVQGGVTISGGVKFSSNGNCVITTNSEPNGTINTNYSSSPIVTQNCIQPLAFGLDPASGQLASGLSINPSTGAITGTPTQSGTFQFIMRVQDSRATPQVATKALSILINPAPPAFAFTAPTSLPNGQVNVAYGPSTGATTANGTSPITFSIINSSLGGSTLPTGLSINSSTGVISGTPTQSGTFNWQIKAADSASHTANSNVFTVVINPASPVCSIATSGALPSAVQNQAGYSSGALVAANCTSPFTYSLNSGTPPTGLTLTTSSGAYTGTATTPGLYTFTEKLVDSSLPTAQTAISQPLNIQVTCPTLSISTTNLTLPPTTVNTAMTATTVTAAGGSGTLTWSATGLPTGESINSSTGVVSGTPTQTGSFSNIVISVKDSCSLGVQQVSKTFTQVINPATLQIANGPPGTGTVGTGFSFAYSAVGGIPPYGFSISAGTITPGLTLGASGNLTGTPTTAGTFAYTVQVADSNTPPGTATQNVSQVINAAAASGADNTYCSPSNVWTGGATDGPANLPQNCIYTARAGTPSPGNVTFVASGSNILGVLNAANCGDVIQLQAGGSFSALQGIPNKACDDAHWITIETSGIASLPAEGTRITPCFAGVASLPGRPAYSCPNPQNVMAKISQTQGSGSGPALDFAPGANHYRFIGIEITRSAGIGLVSILSDMETNNKVILDQVWAHGVEDSVAGTTLDETNAGVYLDLSTNVAVIDSYLNDFFCVSAIGACTDSKAIGGGIGSPSGSWGPYKIVNNFLEAAGENFFEGGGPATTAPADFEIRRNTMFKPQTWNPSSPTYDGGVRGSPLSVKNLLELKNAQRVLIEGNVMQNSWGGFTQNGAGLSLKPTNQNNTCPGCFLENVTTRYNIISNTGQPLLIANLPDTPCTGNCFARDGFNESLHDDVFDHIQYGTCSQCSGFPNEIFSANNATATQTMHDVTINHITQVFDNINGLAWGFVSGPTAASGAEMRNFTFKNSIIPAANFGITNGGPPDNTWCSFGVAASTPNLSACFAPTLVFGNNCIPWGSVNGGTWASLGGGGALQLLADQNAVQYTNLTGENYTLLASSPCHNIGDDGKDAGANIALVNQFTSGPPSVPLQVTNSNLPNGQVSVPMSGAQVQVQGGTPPYHFTCCVSGTIPTSLSLDPNTGAETGTPTVAGTFNFTVTVMDSASPQASVTQAYTQIIANGPPPPPPNALPWVKVSTPASATQIRDFTINPSNNDWFVADRQTGFWRSTDQGNTWVQINASGIPLCGWTIEYDTAHSQLIAGTFSSGSCGVTFWRSSTEGNSWTQIPVSFSISLNPTHTGPLLGFPSGLIDFGGRDGSLANCGSWFSTDGGATTTPITASPACQGSWSWHYNPVTNDIWFGTEAGGIYRSTDGQNFSQVFTPPAPGNAEAINHDTSGNAIVGGRCSTGCAATNGFWRSSGSNGTYSWNVIRQTNASPRSLYRDANGFLYYGQSDTNGQVTPSDTNAVYTSTDQGSTWTAFSTGIPNSSDNANLEAWHILTNPCDGKLYTNVQDGVTNAGSVYRTTSNVTTAIACGPPPPPPPPPGPAWSGILSASRAIDWSKAGLPATFPDGETTPNPWTPPNRLQCGPTLSPSGGDDTSQITNAFNGVGGFSSCTPPYAVLLGAGTFQVNTTLALGGNNARNNVTLRGSGPMNTFITLGASGLFQIGTCCVGGGAGAFTSAASNYTVGQTTFLLQNVNSAPFVGAVARLFQCDNGFTNSSSGNPLGTCAGAATDTLSVFHCSDALCASNGNADSTRQQEQQVVLITSVTNTSGSNWTVTTSPGLYLGDFTFSQGATLAWDNQASYTSVGVGIEDMTIGPFNNNNGGPIIGNGGYASWMKGVREIGTTGSAPSIFAVNECSHCLVTNNYFFSNDPLNFNASFNTNIMQDSLSADTLILNNLGVGQFADDAGDHMGVVYAYNYNRESSSGGDYQATLFEHGPGTNLLLRESNQWGRTNDDDTNGTHNLDTDFRNWFNCSDIPYELGIAGGGLQVGSWARFENAIGNAFGFGTPNKCLSYQGTNTDGFIWNLNGGPASDTSGLTVGSLMRWGNVSQILQASDTPANSGIRFVSSEVPSSLSTWPKSVKYQNSVPSTNNLPCSFFLQGYSATTCTPKYTGHTGFSWWKVCTSWTTFPTVCASSTTPPFPANGPDILAAAGAPNNYANDIPAAVAWKNLPIDTTYQLSRSVTASSWASGTETLTVNLTVGHPMGGFQLSGVAAACVPTSGVSFTGRPDGELIITGSSSTTISYALANNPGVSCNGTVKWPDVRQFDERVYQPDP